MFVIVIVGSLAQDQHIGTRLQVCTRGQEVLQPVTSGVQGSTACESSCWSSPPLSSSPGSSCTAANLAQGPSQRICGLQVSAWVLGPTWLAAVLAGGLMTLAKLAGTDQLHGSSGAGYVAATAVLGLLGLALLVFLQAVAPPGE